MANVFFPYSKAPLRTVKEIQFGLFSPEEIKRMSVVHVEYPETLVGLNNPLSATPAKTAKTIGLRHYISFQDDAHERPRTKGVNDPRLGTIDRQYNCETCEEGPKECPGHFGHIELATPVFHIGMMRTFGMR